jgi:hypothetical protein
VASKLKNLRAFLATICVATAAGVLPSVAVAQGTTQAKIDQAVALYEKFEIEAARPLLQEILSPNWPQAVSTEQRVTALKYLGASYAVISKPDTAIYYFTGALSYDPFTDLDRNKFSPQELAAFERAKTQIFKVGMRPLTSKVVDPKSADPAQTTYPIRITTTQRAAITVTVALRKQGVAGDSAVETVFSGINDGTQTLAWRGMMDGKIAPSGNYEVRISGVSQQLGASRDSTTQKLDFAVRQSYEPLEDTLPTLSVQDTVVASYNPRDPLWDFVKGAALGVAVGTIASFALDDSKVAPEDRGAWKTHWLTAAGVGVGAGLFSFSYRRQHLLRPEAVAENAKRRQMRAVFNQNVRQRNADRLDKTKLIIQPR